MSEDTYHRLFDALAEVRAIEPDHWASIQLHGNAAGRALRSWALRRRLDAVPVIGELPDRTWTQLEVTLPNDVGYLVVVHLEDNIPTATAPIPVPGAELEMPF